MSKHAQSKEREKRKTVIVCLLLAIALAVAGIAGYMLYQNNREYALGDDTYDAISKSVRGMPSKGDTKTEAGGAALAADTAKTALKAYIPQAGINWDELKNINADTIAWLYCPNTVIDYPVAMAEDYSYYLTHLIDGTYNKNGTLFLDYNCAPDFTDRLSIIYGHHMKSGRMFGTLVKYKEQEYYEQHPYMYLYTEQGNYRIDLIYGCVIGAGEWSDGGYMYQENLGSLLEYAKDNTTFESGVTYTDKDKFLALSTCSYEFEEARYVVLGVMIPEYEKIPEVNENGIK